MWQHRSFYLHVAVQKFIPPCGSTEVSVSMWQHRSFYLCVAVQKFLSLCGSTEVSISVWQHRSFYLCVAAQKFISLCGSTKVDASRSTPEMRWTCCFSTEQQPRNEQSSLQHFAAFQACHSETCWPVLSFFNVSNDLVILRYVSRLCRWLRLETELVQCRKLDVILWTWQWTSLLEGHCCVSARLYTAATSR